MSDRWTSRKRVETTLNHQQPDRVPLSMPINEVPYRRPQDYLGLQDRPLFSQAVWQNILRPVLRRRWKAAMCRAARELSPYPF